MIIYIIDDTVIYRGGSDMKKLISTALCISIILSSAPSYGNSFVMHTVQPGESYSSISKEFNVELNELKALNEDIDDTIYSGSLVKIKPISKGITIKIRVDDKIINPDISPYIEKDRTHVPIRFIAQALGINEILWNEETKTATLIHNEKTAELTLGSNIAKVNGKELILDAPISIYEGRTFVPLRFISEIFNCIVSWDYENYSVLINKDSSHSEDLYWLARIVQAESEGEPFEGKLAVANVVLNRKESTDFPNSVKGVIFDKAHGYQYTPVQNGAIFNSPSPESIQAAALALDGNNNISDSLYFLNSDIATSRWIVENRTFHKRIGLHDFYK